ncbi:uncharacterized protein METZ01_LOCUS457419 [marine metagenome]|uniref:Uncharacterized protein n=1 Tax=marine metagenome TaxID=408172 RepID=A0A383ABK5_9ZZZZ
MRPTEKPSNTEAKTFVASNQRKSDFVM